MTDHQLVADHNGDPICTCGWQDTRSAHTIEWAASMISRHGAEQSQIASGDRRRTYALIFNAISEVSREDGVWWPWSQRKKAADAVIAALDVEAGLDDLANGRTESWTEMRTEFGGAT